ncbi:unnamed protein product [Vicia faba]|uniref:Uncharacterized protein n=1 Tax=Vicia faba TaxID=3906 RepID=A0AAV0YNX0_VICFA|nr:unnamed protein product [Vicia faba]
MVKHLYQESGSSLQNGLRLKQEGIIEGKVYFQDGGPPNFEQPTLGRKNKLKKIGHGIIHLNRMNSHKSKSVINQRHDMMTGEEEVGVLKSSHKIYVLDNSFNIPIIDKSDLVANMSVVPLRFGSMRNHHDKDS